MSVAFLKVLCPKNVTPIMDDIHKAVKDIGFDDVRPAAFFLFQKISKKGYLK